MQEGEANRIDHVRAQRRAPENLEAWELYQRAAPLIHHFTRSDSDQARALLERAFAFYPQFSTALARLSEVRISFRLGTVDAEILAKEFYPEFSSFNICHFPFCLFCPPRFGS
ncbi:hypothetical protein L0152_15765 [bacterium]|nr:hypothetical protein [bacterium]